MVCVSRITELLNCIASTPHGLLRLIQALTCHQQELSTSTQISEFFIDLLEHCNQIDDWPNQWPAAWDAVARGVSRHVNRPNGHVRRLACPPGAQAPKHVLTTIISEDTWLKYHVDPFRQELSEELYPTISFPISANLPAAEQTLDFLLSAAKSTTGPWLGRPASDNANCWVSCAKIAESEPVEPHHGNLEELLDALGIAPTNPEWSWIRFTIDPSQLDVDCRSPERLGTRPGFADLGSEWFRIDGQGESAQRHRRHGWGSTVNLSDVRELSETSPILEEVGLPERVTPSILVHQSVVRNKEILPPQIKNYEKMRNNDLANFIQNALDGRSKDDIVEELTTIVAQGNHKKI